MEKRIEILKTALEYLGGAVDEAPQVLGWLRNPFLWGAWWAFLILLIVTFGGQSSKFIYIDF